MWKFVPPNPKALTPALRMPSPLDPGFSQARSSVFTRKGDVEKSMAGLGARKLTLGGIWRWCSASAALSTPAAPAAPFKCPMLDFTDPSGIEPAGSPEPWKAARSVSTSTTSPTLVEVPCPSIKSPGAGAMPAFSHARVTAKR